MNLNDNRKHSLLSFPMNGRIVGLRCRYPKLCPNWNVCHPPTSVPLCSLQCTEQFIGPPMRLNFDDFNSGITSDTGIVALRCDHSLESWECALCDPSIECFRLSFKFFAAALVSPFPLYVVILWRRQFLQHRLCPLYTELWWVMTLNAWGRYATFGRWTLTTLSVLTH